MSWQYRKRVYAVLEQVKKSINEDDRPAKVHVYNENGTLCGWLEPLTLKSVTTGHAIRLGRWREENSFAFPSQFKVTVEGTKKWLKNQVIDNPERILFYIFSDKNTHHPVGHLGLASFDFDQNSLELDNVLRGDKFNHPGLMSMGVRALIDWANKYLSPKSIFLRVMSDNKHAIEFYKQIGFVRKEYIPVGEHKFLKMKYEK